MPGPDRPRILGDTAAVVAGAAPDAAGAVWKLQMQPRDLDANIIRLPAGAGIEPHAGPDLDVLLVVLDGSGQLGTELGPVELRAGALVWLPRRQALCHLELRPADWHLFVGDEAALPAIGALLEALDGPASVIAEVGDGTDEIELRAPTTWLHRNNEPPGGSALFAAALAQLPARENGRAYLLGESRAMVALRPSIERLGITPERAYVKGYWNVGRAGRRVPN